MTTLNQAREAIYDRFNTEWPGATSSTPFCFDNEEFDPPKGSDGRGAAWARCSVRQLDRGQTTLGRAGNRKFTSIALAQIEVFVPPKSGRYVADALLEAGKNLFEGRTPPTGTTIRFFDVVVSEVGLIEDGRWDLSTVEARFDYEETK